MSSSNNISIEDNSNASSSSIGIPPSVAFWTYLISYILSLVCTLFVLYYLLFDRTLRYALNNHVIIILLFMGLIYELTTIPWTLYRFHYGSPWIQNPTFYLFSFFFDYGIYSTQIALFAWATIERHILIFHDQLVKTKKKRLFIHYLPIITILIYCLVYYSLVTWDPFCEKLFETFMAMGLYIPCVFNKTVLGTWDLLFHQVIPTIIIVICSVVLIARVVYQKRKVNQTMQWRKYRKMTIQLLSISALYFIFNSPWTILIFASQYGLPHNVTAIPLSYVIYLRTYVIFLFPFVCCASLPELQQKLKRLLHWQRRHRIVVIETIEMERINRR